MCVRSCPCMCEAEKVKDRERRNRAETEGADAGNEKSAVVKRGEGEGGRVWEQTLVSHRCSRSRLGTNTLPRVCRPLQTA